ncbi:hypothetical protein F4779DRAFT_601620 [Xylariaceae sp. FL0662B]|nr:hypothetical protein F4779DRAFT_601620 [Xylariaceae sp. FL0662B]
MSGKSEPIWRYGLTSHNYELEIMALLKSIPREDGCPCVFLDPTMDWSATSTRADPSLVQSKYKTQFRKIPLHLVVPGTRISSRPAALLAALSIRMGIEPFMADADIETINWSRECIKLGIPGDLEDKLPFLNPRCRQELRSTSRSWRGRKQRFG